MEFCGCCAARVIHNVPGAAIIVQNRTPIIDRAVTISDRKDIARRASPYIPQRYAAALYRVIHNLPGCAAIG